LNRHGFQNRGKAHERSTPWFSRPIAEMPSGKMPLN
jgi:hypothetical protein